MLIALAFCLLILLYYLYAKNYNYWKKRKVPYEKPFLIFGSFYNVAMRKKHISQEIKRTYNKFSDSYVGIFTFHQPALVVRSPQLIKKILIQDFDHFINRKIATNEKIDPIVAHTLFSAKDHIWRELRSKLSPVFTSSKVKLMFPLMVKCGKDMVSLVRENQTVEIKTISKKYAVDVISSCAFGVNSNCLKNDDFNVMKAATKLVDFTSFLRSFSLFSYFFAPKLVDIFKLSFLEKTTTDFFINMFMSTLDNRERENIRRNDFIDLLNELRHDTKFNFDDTKMVAQALAFFTAGNDTTSSAITFTLYELAIDQKIQNHLRDEIRIVLEKYDELTYENIQEIEYLDMVLKGAIIKLQGHFLEAMRKYPLTSFLSRESKTKYTFEETGFTLDPNISVIIPLAGLHYDPQYFPDPEMFIPERFSKENKSKIVPFTYLPFGDGPRNCIGKKFGLVASKVALVHLIKNFHFELMGNPKAPLDLDPNSLFMWNKDKIVVKIIKIG